MSKLPDPIRMFLEQVCAAVPEVPFGIRMHDQTTIAPAGGGSPRFTLVLRRAESLHKLQAAADFQALGELYLRDVIDIEGDIEAIYPVAEFLQDNFERGLFGGMELSDFMPFAAEAGEQAHTPESDADAIEFHYDQSNAVFERICDPTMNYSSAVFHSADESLHEAQKNKLGRVCAKADLQPGERVLDIGCGWGAVLSWAATHHGVDITGITISKAQAEYVEARLQREGITDNTHLKVCDYRHISEDRPFDKVISLGMVEHVGVKNLPTYFDKAFALLKPGGVFVLQGVSTEAHMPTTEANGFTQNYLFPDADLPYLNQYLDAAQNTGFEVRDVENLREHYALTHRHWRLNLEADQAAIAAEIGEQRYRALRLLFSYSTHYFHVRYCSVYQFVLWKPQGQRPSLPWKRAL